MLNSKSSTRKRALKAGYRSGLEEQTAKDLKKRKVLFTYEETKIKWLDSKVRTYTPDFVLPNGVIIETKGRFVAADRRKHGWRYRNNLEHCMISDLFSLTAKQSFTKGPSPLMLIGVTSTVSYTQTRPYLRIG